MITIGKKNACTVEELHDLTAKYEDLKEAIVKLFNDSSQMSPQEFTQAAKRLAQELKMTAQQLKDCQRNLVDPEKVAEEFLKQYSIV